MLTISGLSKAYGSQYLLHNVDFQLTAKERIGVLGRNGHGKTTLFNIILGEEYHDQGEVTIPKNYRIGCLEQHINFTKATILEEGCLGLPPGQEEETWNVEKILAGLGFSQEDMQRPPSEFSGGYQVRLNLAKTLISQPNLLLLDEPTNYLDIISIRWLERFLRSWPGEIMFITHDRQFMDRVATHVLGIHRQKIRKIAGDTSKYLQQIQQDEEIHEKTRVNEAKKRKQEELFITRFRAKARLAGMVQSRIKALDKRTQLDKLDNIKSLSFSFRWEKLTAKIPIGVDNLNFSYGFDMPELIQDLTFNMASSDHIAVVGPNGKGKSTLLKLLTEKLSPISGNIKKHPNLKIGYFEQSNVEHLDPRRTVEEEIMYADPNMDRRRVRDICGAMMFQGDNALKPISVLSGGEKCRVCLGKLLAAPCNLLLLDEPTNHLDTEACDALMDAINKFEGGVIIVTHNERLLYQVPQRLIVFDKGKQSVYESNYSDFLKEVGWSGEEQESQTVKTKSGNRKVLRKQRAAFIKERNNALNGYKNQIKKLENSITIMEKEVHDKNKDLITASGEGNSQKITELSKSIHNLETKTDKAYTDLDEVMCALEAAEKKYAKE